MKYYEKLYYYGKYTLYALYVVAYLGLWDKAPKYLDDFDYYLKILIVCATECPIGLHPINLYTFSKSCKGIE